MIKIHYAQMLIMKIILKIKKIKKKIFFFWKIFDGDAKMVIREGAFLVGKRLWKTSNHVFGFVS